MCFIDNNQVELDFVLVVVFSFNQLEETSQNDAVIGINVEGKECLMDVYTTSTQFTLPGTNQMFFYVFLENGSRRITSGKLIVKP